MAWYNFWKNETVVKESATAQVQSKLITVGDPAWTPRNYKKLAKESYGVNVVAYKCINEIAANYAQIPWKVCKRNSDGSKTFLPDHPLQKLLNRPNPWQGGFRLKESFAAYYNLSGNSYLEEITTDTLGYPTELYCLRPDRMKVLKGRAGPSGYRYEVNGIETDWLVDEVTGECEIFHSKTFNPFNDYYGMSPVEAAAYSVDIHNSANSWNKALMDNSAQPSGALVYAPNEGPAFLEEEEKADLKKELDQAYSGAKNAGRPMLLEGGLQWQAMSFSPREMDWLNNKNTSARDICNAFDVPPMLIGIPGDNTYSNQKEARLAFWEENIIPLNELSLSDINNWLVPKFDEEGLEVVADYDGVSALALKRESVWNRVKDASFLTINEKREATGYEKFDDPAADQLYQDFGAIPLGQEIDKPVEDEKEFENWLKDYGIDESLIKEIIDAGQSEES